MYITTQIVQAVQMTAYEYQVSQGYDGCEDFENIDGYKITDDDGVTEWICEDEFKKRYRNVVGQMTFGDAIEYLKKGYLVTRKGWNGKGMYLFIRPEDTLSLETIVKAKSLPDKFKDKVLENPDTESVKFGAYICMKCADGSICNGWLASQTDMLSNDWMLVLAEGHE